jgi:hypothetical protein
MNRAFDYNGVQIAPSKPVQKLRTVRKTLQLNSGDRDIVQYPTNGDIVLYLPRVYERVVSISVLGAEFPPIGSAYVHPYGSTGATYASDIGITATNVFSIYLDVDGLNKSDETASRADRSAYVDSTFAKFQIPGTRTDPIIHNENSGIKNDIYFQPPISKLDRLKLRTRLHSQKGAIGTPQNTYGFIYWSGGTATNGGEYGITLELETLENSFDDFSSLETRIGERAPSGFHGC